MLISIAMPCQPATNQETRIWSRALADKRVHQRTEWGTGAMGTVARALTSLAPRYQLRSRLSSRLCSSVILFLFLIRKEKRRELKQEAIDWLFDLWLDADETLSTARSKKSVVLQGYWPMSFYSFCYFFYLANSFLICCQHILECCAHILIFCHFNIAKANSLSFHLISCCNDYNEVDDDVAKWLILKGNVEQNAECAWAFSTCPSTVGVYNCDEAKSSYRHD